MPILLLNQQRQSTVCLSVCVDHQSHEILSSLNIAAAFIIRHWHSIKSLNCHCTIITTIIRALSPACCRFLRPTAAPIIRNSSLSVAPVRSASLRETSELPNKHTYKHTSEQATASTSTSLDSMQPQSYAKSPISKLSELVEHLNTNSCFDPQLPWFPVCLVRMMDGA